MARAPKPIAEARPAPRLRRAYYDCRYGQLHIHNAIPAGGGFDELTPLVCLHGEGETGRVFVPLMAALGADRSVYALDLPGRGETDPSPGVEATTAGVHAAADFIQSMRLRKVDLLATGTGCAVALALSEQLAGGIRRSVLLASSTPARLPGNAVVLPASVLAAPDGGHAIGKVLA